MKVEFLSIDDQMNKVRFETEVTEENEWYVFQDLSTTDTKIKLKIENNQVHFVRTGMIQMDMLFDPDKITPGFYKNQNGLEFTFSVECFQLRMKSEQVIVFYYLIVDEGIKTKHKISVIFH